MTANTNKAGTESIVHREDYAAPDHNVESIHLTFDLVPNQTTVTARMIVIPKDDRKSDDFVLYRDDVSMTYLKIGGKDSLPGQYAFVADKLIIHDISEPIEIEIQTRINPRTNLQLSGLYMSRNNYITQCEAEGFRRIMYFPDRPDVLAKYRVVIHAPKDYKALLSNGNLMEQGELLDGRNYAIWDDPFPKPSYLFALVAGNFVAQEETIKLANGKEALLQIWTEPSNQGKTDFAMQSLIKAIRWDEERFGLDLDLDRFMIVATDDFNMGAMENKGLNIFNSKCVLADSRIATDEDFARIESVIAHEYFHNWTGDRVTCRDWFQLSLKEGLTVFREQEFAADMLGTPSARAVKRIQDVRYLRTNQFPEDAGPMAHPIRPESYRQIDNFYTTTVYEKGAEVVRMYQTLFGKEGFRRGLLEYINRFDGTAATCSDFLTAMEESNGEDLSQFELWYSQAGTPRVSVSSKWDENEKTLTLTLHQSNRSFPGRAAPKPLLIPVSIGILGDDGKDIELQLQGEDNPDGTTRTLLFDQQEQTWVFENINSRPILSIGRGYSAPVIFDIEYTKDQLAFLARNDSDLFNRAEAFDRLTLLMIDQYILDLQKKGPNQGRDHIPVSEAYLFTFEDILNDESLSPAYRAELLKFPDENYIAEHRILIEPALVREVSDQIRKKIGTRLRATLEDKVQKMATPGAYRPNPIDAGKRALKHVCLGYLAFADNPKAIQQIRALYKTANNLTDQLAALKISVEASLPIAQELLNMAEIEWQREPLLMNKWLTLHSRLRHSREQRTVVEKIHALTLHGSYQPKNPNCIYSLLYAFFRSGGPEFHRPDGMGYQLWVNSVLSTDQFNPQVAARLARVLENWRRYEPSLSRMMYKALRFVNSHRELSPDVREIIENALYEPV
ncbi:aminopeptidase N [uncultured Parasutterella sp.]|uniref:aminopeptidase N n=1 Tax=uncultured Parasutterella sp. TaxID=1263098 RepID=UPI00272C9ADE|nr:aminopeptidase N [uncultured Parasutterella sp.]